MSHSHRHHHHSQRSRNSAAVPRYHSEVDESEYDDEDDEHENACVPFKKKLDDNLLTSEVIEILKNLAACKEKEFRWEQSKSALDRAPETDPNKQQLLKIIRFIEQQKNCTRDKAIFLYEQLGQRCAQHKNYIGAAKAFERAASLRYDLDLSSTGTVQQEPTVDDVSATVRNLEAAIENYAAIHKYKHAGTLHYRCSRILRRINAPHRQVDRHHEKALEYFTKPDHELKNRKRVDGLKISCYSSYSTQQQMHRELESLGQQHTTTTTTTTNMIKFHSEDNDDPEDDDDASNDSIDGRGSFSEFGHSPRSSKGGLSQSARFYSHQLHHTSYSSHPTENRTRMAHCDEYFHTSRKLENRVEAAQKLVKKLRRQFPFYEVSATGPEKGRVFCRTCNRYLGAVSSTLKNHANTQEHQQSVQEEEEERRDEHTKVSKVNKNSQILSPQESLFKKSYSKKLLKKRKIRNKISSKLTPNLSSSSSSTTSSSNGLPSTLSHSQIGYFEMAPDLRDIELQPLTPSAFMSPLDSTSLPPPSLPPLGLMASTSQSTPIICQSGVNRDVLMAPTSMTELPTGPCLGTSMYSLNPSAAQCVSTSASSVENIYSAETNLFEHDQFFHVR